MTLGTTRTGIPLGPHARVPAPLRWAMLGAAMAASVTAIALDAGPPLWFETLSVRWFSVRVPLLSWLVGMLVFLLPTVALAMALGSMIARLSPDAPPPTVLDESSQSLGRFVLLVFCVLGILFTLLFARTSLQMLGADPTTRIQLGPDSGSTHVAGSFVSLGFDADTRCRIDLHRFGRGTYDTRQRWQPSPAPDGESAAYVLRYVERPPPRGRTRLELAGDTGYLAGPVPRSIQAELARQGCPVRPDALLLIASQRPPPPWLRVSLLGALLLALVLAALWCLRKPPNG